MSEIAYVDGAYNRASGTRNAFGALSADLVAEGLPAMVSLSGDREPDVQLRIWYERMTLTPNGRKVYGTKKWQGKTWYQIHPDTVAIPNTSNHEARRSNDLKWPYNDQSTAAHKRARVLATRHNITCEGLSFKEPWHWTSWGPLGTIAAPAGGGTTTEEDDMFGDADRARALNIHTRLDAVFTFVEAMAPRLQLVEGAVARFPGDGSVQPRTDDLAVWLGIIMDMIRSLPGGAEVDEEALAAALAPKLAAQLPAHTGMLSDGDLARISKAVADEQAKRLSRGGDE